MKKLFFLLIATLLFSFSKSAFSQEKKIPLITLNTGSFLYHFVPKSNDDYTQFFNNRYLSIGVKITKKGYFSFGTMLNSHGDRMATIGFKTNLYTFSEKIHLQGFYAYSGEFFFKAFSHAGNRGNYLEVKKRTGIGFIPVIYHGIDIKLNSFLAIEVGITLWVIPFASLRWDLFPVK